MKRLVSEDADEGSDPDPDPDPDREGHPGPLYVPVRFCSAGGHELRLTRTECGTRTAVGFTSSARLTATLGERQSWIILAEPALRARAGLLGAAVVTVDPLSGTLPALLPAPPLTPSAPGRRIAPGGLCARRAVDLSEAISV